MPLVEARGLRKAYDGAVALDGLDLTIGEGSVVGLLGPNGAGKTTALQAILGLTSCEGSLRVFGRDPRVERHRLMRDAAYIADVAVLPRWMRASQALDYLAGVHPRFDRARAERLLARTDIPPRARVRSLSKGMVAQLHLALALAIDARLLVLDEPTLGLDAAFRQRFYETLLTDYLERRRTIVIATHQVDEIEHVVTDVAVLQRGRLVLACGMERLAARFVELAPRPAALQAARALGPIHERRALGRTVLLFDGVDRAALAPLGDVRVPSLGDVFAAVTDDGRARERGAA
jgi:ABC-2 type transport system ATP-binding protein